MARIVLASSSPRRAESLCSLGLEFVVFSPDIDEEIEIQNPEKLVRELSLRKAKAVVQNYGLEFSQKDVVIAGDTDVVLNGEILGKPRDAEHEREMLRKLSGNVHEVHSGLCVGRASQLRTYHSKTDVVFREFGGSVIDWYVETGEWKDKSGGYAVQGLGSRLVKEVRGDYNTVIALPLDLLKEALRGFGVGVPS